jgi:glycosyltransferase involved in cell wall biosynthesis
MTDPLVTLLRCYKDSELVEMKTVVTIGLCVKNGAKTIETAFDSISIQDFPHELMKLVIVDDRSNDNTLSLALDFAKKTDMPTYITISKGTGLGATRQLAVDNAKGDYIVWIDDDLVLTKDYIRNQVEFMEKNKKLGAARGFYNKFSAKPLLNILDYDFSSNQSKPLIQINTGGSIFRLRAIENVNGFDVLIKGAGEDLDISHRISEAGWILEINKLAGFHHKYSPATFKDLLKRNSWYGYGNHFLWHKYRDLRLILNYFPPFALLGGLKMARMMYLGSRMKRTFLFCVLYSLSMTVSSFGFIHAHLDGYGHFRESK